jgi:hypothetical protein
MEKKFEDKHQADSKKTREYADKKISAFIKDEKVHRIEFPPMQKYQVFK